jgi:hypothetical protein
MDIIAEIRRRHFIENETITSLAEAFKLSRPTSASISRRLQSLLISVKLTPPEVGSIPRAVRSLVGTRGPFSSKTKAYCPTAMRMPPGREVSWLLYCRTTLYKALAEKAGQQSHY